MTKPRKQQGFISVKEAQKRAKGFGISTTGTSIRIALEKVPREWVLQSAWGKKGAIKIREDKLLEILKRTPKQGVIPKGYFTVTGLIKEAKKQGVTLNKQSVKYRFAQWLEKPKENSDKIKGFAVDIHDPRHRWFFSPENAKALIQWAREVKEAPQLARVGMIVPMTTIAESEAIGLDSAHWACQALGLRKIKIGRKTYLKPEDAKRLRAYLAEGSHRGKRKK
ncbi:MAG: hypothetical protein JW772_01305 [Candidatus Diapherotrites archaeon]|nr:hypothetical protein [Candidatus Diapherotrites archaeon]